MKNKKNLPLLLLILDGWGLGSENKGNPVTLAPAKNFFTLFKKYPHSKLYTYGKNVGLPAGQDGNSEAGHLNIGAGRIVKQDSTIISDEIKSKKFFKNKALKGAMENVKKNNSKLHLMGIVSREMCPHVSKEHILALLQMARKHKIKHIYLHVFTDGRDSYCYDGINIVKDLEKHLQNNEKIVTVMGRFYLDRKKKWERTKIAYEALVNGKGEKAESSGDAILKSYKRGDSDEFIKPFIIKNGEGSSRIENKDSVIFFNLRSDRARQLTKVFVQKEFNKLNPKSFRRSKFLSKLYFVALTDFGPDLDLHTAYKSFDVSDTLPMVLGDLKQLYTSETEKYAHVTYFFNGGYSSPVAGEHRVLIPSPNVKTYDLTPAMQAPKLTEMILNNLKKNKYDFTVVNFAAPDMVGHTGNLKAGIKCCQIIDGLIAKLSEAYLQKNGTVIITADHGNVEEMIKIDTGEVDTKHSHSLVPFILINNKLKKAKLKYRGVLGDIAPTILDILGRNKPKEMTGKSLILKK